MWENTVIIFERLVPEEEWDHRRLEHRLNVECVIPVPNNEVEVTHKSIEDLKNGQLEYIGGIKDHEGEFREWHEMTSLLSKDDEFLHILPYCVID